MTVGDIEHELWSMANAITVFSIVQVITALYAVSKGDFAKMMSSSRYFISGLLATAVICPVAYAFAVWYCMQLALQLTMANERIWRQITVGRIGAIAFFEMIAVVGALIVIRGRRAIVRRAS